ncbi:butyrophilin subfamily 3 member A2-like [Hemicordylus capensis]|uniref:butyrophilin subfamily 3 member A2-like n=1 Tax=Hemicordylus capensis TaxID=884348 RepID=UPI002304CEE9|nr:butyrophilin subfamily 3 member A2-like [Hemicordylus capensis]
MCSSSTAVWILMVLQMFHVVHAGQFSIIPPQNPTIGFLGEEVILPCQLTTKTISESISIDIHWMFMKSSEKISVKSYGGKNKEDMQDGRYQDRADLFYNELNRGNMSLKLKNSQISDQGKYICMVSLGDWYDEAVVELNLTANGAEPAIALELYKGQGIGLTCSSSGWYPKPQVLWLDSKGKPQTEKAEATNIQQEPGGTFSVSSSFTTEQGADNEVSCKIINSILQTESESRILISDDFYPSTSPWLPPFIIILLHSLSLTAFLVYALIQSYQTVSQSVEKKNAIKAEQEHLNHAIDIGRTTSQTAVADLQKRSARLTDELDFRRAQSLAASVILDPDYKHPEVTISENNRVAQLKPPTAGQPVTAPFVMGKEGYAAGKHYWEVKVGDRLDWELGVLTQAARDKAKKEMSVDSLGEEFWTLRSCRGGLFSGKDKIEKKDVSCLVIGMFLDQQDARTISFYNAELMFHMNSIPIQSEEKLFPFFSFGKAAEDKDQSVLEIVPVSVIVRSNNFR